jgi:hypothetical protein
MISPERKAVLNHHVISKQQNEKYTLFTSYRDSTRIFTKQQPTH